MLRIGSFNIFGDPYEKPDTENVVPPTLVVLTDPVGRPNTED